jgi:transposase
MQYIAFDSHKRYTFASVEDHATGKVFDRRIDHESGALREFLSAVCEPGSPVAVETIGNWYWIVDEIEAAGMKPQLVHARKAKMMLASSKKTDKLDAHGINRLQRVGTLPTVWIPNGSLRDRRELFRTRMTFTRRRTGTKNRIHATLSKHGIRLEDTSDIFNKKGRLAIEEALSTLPEHTQFATQALLSELDELEAKIKEFEDRIVATFSETADIKLLRTIPGIGPILAEVIASEIGDVSRFATAARLASYAGTSPSVHASGGKYRYGRAPADTNHYLKWAYAEAANTITRVRRRLRYRHVADLYDRIRSRKGHSIAIGAVSRHLAEASWAMLTKKEPYREPVRKKEAVSSTSG